MRQMKDSGIEWVGQIPQVWDVLPNKYIMKKTKELCQQYSGQAILSLTMNGVIERDLDAGGKMPSSFDGYQIIKKGNLLLCLFDIDVTPRCAGLILKDGVTSPAYSQFVMTNMAYAPYFAYYYIMVDNTKELLHMTKNLRYSLNEEQFGSIKAPCPPLAEQERIAEFLDDKCAEVDALAGEIKEQIATLEEYKRSVITEAVTKGLDASVPMKNSGIEWIGEIPQAWGTLRLKYCLISNDGGVWGIDPIDESEAKIVLRSTEQTIDGQWCINDPTTRNLTGINLLRYRIKPHDLLITKSSGSSLHIGKTTIADSNFKENEFYYSNFLQRLRVDDTKIVPRMAWYLLNASFIRAQFVYLQNSTSGLGNINSSNIDELVIPKCPLAEQERIAEFLDAKCAEVDALIAEKQNQLATLEEYKKSVIFEYVTGKKEVV